MPSNFATSRVIVFNQYQKLQVIGKFETSIETNNKNQNEKHSTAPQHRSSQPPSPPTPSPHPSKETPPNGKSRERRFKADKSGNKGKINEGI